MSSDPTDPEPTPSWWPGPDDLTRTRKQTTEPFPHPPADDPADPPPPCGRFHPVRLFRDGGMGRVFAARDTELGREVAFKWMKDRTAAHPPAVELFVREAELTGRLEHPGVAPVYGFGRTAEGRPFYAMRLVRGPTLGEAIEAFHAGGPARGLSADDALALRRLLGRFLAVCQTVAFAHSNGVIHRDLKPGNVVLGPFGETVVLDWGLARAERGPFERPGSQLGTPAYWAPEQQHGRPDAHDRRTDVYGLGGVLYALLCGRPPNARGCCPPAPPVPSAVCPWVDGDLDRVVTTALATDPADRYRSADAQAGEVERWLADQPAAAQRATVADLRARLAADPDDRPLAEQLARQVANLGLVLAGMTREADAAAAFAEAADRFAALNVRAARARYQVEEANARVSLGRALDRLGRTDEADRERGRAADIYRRLSEREPGKYRVFATLILPPKDAPRAAPPPAEPPAEPATGVGFEADMPRTPPLAAPAVPRPANPPTDAGGTGWGLAPADAERTDVPIDRDEAARTFAPDDGPAGGPADAPPPGYKVVRSLGQGGMGSVYLARDEALDRLVAIKELAAAVADRPAFVARFLREARALAGLRHGNIMAVYAYGVRSGTGRPYLVTEYIEGEHAGRLAERFHEGGGRPARGEPLFDGLIAVYAQAADALHYAHRKGIVHRDPKPHNILVRPDGTAVVLDWGLALVAGTADAPADGPAPADEFTTAAGTVMGTPAYMSPEQARDATKVDARSDVYVLGAGLFLVLTGRPAFAGASPMEMLARVVEGRIPRPREVRPDVPAELDAICAKAMARDPADRYQTAADLAAALRGWLAGPPAAAAETKGWWSRLTGR
jgi:serine/threonine protein kinase